MECTFQGYSVVWLHTTLTGYDVRFLWRKNASFAISRHYKRFDVFVEAEANKAAAKYDNASIDLQIDFYRKEGLTPYSEAKLPIRSGIMHTIIISLYNLLISLCLILY